MIVIFEKLLLFSVLGTVVLAHPGKLKEPKFEFQQIAQAFESREKMVSPIHESDSETAKVVPVQFEGMPWSQSHPHEVNALAEMFRQHFNDKVELHNEMMAHHHQLDTENVFEPVTLMFYDFHNEDMRNNFFGSNQQFADDLANQFSLQLIQFLHQGLITQKDIHNSDFFQVQAAGELERIQIEQAHFEPEDYGNDEQQHQLNFIPDDQQQQYQEFHHPEREIMGNEKTALVFNPHTGFYEEVNTESEATDMIQSAKVVSEQSITGENSNRLRTFNVDREIDHIEVHKPAWIEYPREIQKKLTEPSTTTMSPSDNFYASTYDQQPIYDRNSLMKLSRETSFGNNNVMPLVRKKPKPTFTTITSTTTKKPTKVSNVMSMLEHKKDTFNATAVMEKLKHEMQKHRDMEENATETHFMGLSSNKDQEKISYSIVDNAAKNIRDSQSSFEEDSTDENVTLLDDLEKTTMPITTISQNANALYSAPLAPYPEQYQLLLQDVQNEQIPNNQFDQFHMDQQQETIHPDDIIDINQIEEIQEHISGSEQQQKQEHSAKTVETISTSTPKSKPWWKVFG
ncbi:uncharacterized protein LOC129743712 [Uranotaenia lowii]|uniref:uncharacterized protein LOC129743712 n=1 Tax=Uranotaenia lowii TaxID=190385 RepID=UPI002479940C|nr:uncharacterized protein LOC129743712 [Uranotaenia lowii]